MPKSKLKVRHLEAYEPMASMMNDGAWLWPNTPNEIEDLALSVEIKSC